VHISRDEFPCRVIDKISTLIEEIPGVPDVSLGLRHGGNINEHQRLTQVVVRAESAYGAC
jgi:hypothetical protein